MHQLKFLFIILGFFYNTGYCSNTSTEDISFQSFDRLSSSISIDSIIIDTLLFEDMNDDYRIRRYMVEGTVVQMDIDRLTSSTLIDYILWDADKNGRMEAIGVYNVLEQKYDYYLIEHDLAADDLLEYQVQLEDIGFPAFFDSSAIPKAVYKDKAHQPILNYVHYK